METQLLRDLVERRLNLRWSDFATTHPNLAQAIDQTRLLHHTVDKIQDDPQLIEALRQADLDEHQLAAAMTLLEVIERWLTRVLPV